MTESKAHSKDTREEALNPRRRPTLAQVIKRAQERGTRTNFMNELHAMERRRNYRLQLAQVNDMIFGNLTPGMRENLGHRKKALEKNLREVFVTEKVFDKFPSNQ